MSLRPRCSVMVVLVALLAAGAVNAQPTPRAEDASAAPAPRAAAQGVAVVAGPGARAEAFTLARAVYASTLRPRRLDEVRARVLAGDAAPAGASKELRELAELRSSVTGEDAASRRLLGAIAREVNVAGLLVVQRVPAGGAAAPAPAAGLDADAGAAPSAEAAPADGDAGAASSPPASPSPAPVGEARTVARLFLPDSGDFDAARYEPDPTGGWRSTVVSLASRFPAPPAPAEAHPQRAAVPPPRLPAEGTPSKPFYSSPWFWGALGAAAVIGGLFFLASQDTEPGPIHLQMKVPR